MQTHAEGTRSLSDNNDLEEVYVPDYEPLVHLTQAKALHLLTKFADRIVILDVVEMQAMHFLDDACRNELKAWIDAGASPDTDTPVEIRTTSTASALMAARIADPGFQWRNITHYALLEYMLKGKNDIYETTVLLYESWRLYYWLTGIPFEWMRMSDFLWSDKTGVKERILSVAPNAQVS